jgi:HEAT repeat protein
MRLKTPLAIVLAATMPMGLVSTAPAQMSSQNPQDARRGRLSTSRGSGEVNDAARKLRSDTPEDRLEATRMLAESDDPKAIEFLLGAATDTDMRVRIKAIDELGNRRATEATPLFIQQLFLRETDPAVQQRVLVALGKIGDPRSTRPICDFLSRDLDPRTKGTAIFALGEIGDKDALGVLGRLAATPEDPVTSRLATEAASKINHDRPQSVEIRALTDERAPPE